MPAASRLELVVSLLCQLDHRLFSPAQVATLDRISLQSTGDMDARTIGHDD